MRISIGAFQCDDPLVKTLRLTLYVGSCWSNNKVNEVSSSVPKVHFNIL